MSLPIDQVVPEVLAGLQRGNVLLQAEPGAGKSTGLPLSLVGEDPGFGKIVMLEPRRLAARNVAERLAFQLGEPLGQSIGLRMRGQTVVSAATQLEVVTEGVLTRVLQADPLLEGIGLVIFDEFHERSLHADLGLALCLDVQQGLRDDLRLLLMSATLDTSPLSRHLENAKTVSCEVRQHPVAVNWVPENSNPLPQRTASVIKNALSSHTGDVLVFLPGVAEIEKTAALLQPALASNVYLHRLHSGVSREAQRAATAPSTSALRRVILSTSIAETSITIDGVTVVVDSGLERRGRIDTNTGASRLETVKASQASATQRSGRAGRTAPGVCYRLWSETGHSRRVTSWQAEILRADLAPLLMETSQWGAATIADLPWLEPPPGASIGRAAELLKRLGIWHQGRLTEHGRAVARLPVHPRLGHMLLWAAKQGARDIACKLAVVLEDTTQRPGGADIERLLQRSLSKPQTQRVSQLKKLLPQGQDKTITPSPGTLLAQAWPDWIAQRRAGQEARFALSCGAGAALHNDDALGNVDWLSVAQLGGTSQPLRIFGACQLSIPELLEFSPDLFCTQHHLDWDDRAERVLAEERQLLGSLVVSSRPMHKISNTDRAKALVSGIRRRGLDCLPWNDECNEWQARVLRLQQLPTAIGQADWPDVNNTVLLGSLEKWLLPWLEGIGSLKALAKLDMRAILAAMLDYRQQRLLDELLPVKYKVPSGSLVKLRYAGSANPVLSVKLQEMFGCTDNPSVANGAIPLTVELLSPARRPVQVTQDLANFWTNSYPAVKKDMAGRYPKHPWPDNPLESQATARAKPRKR